MYLYRSQDPKGVGLKNALYVFHSLLCQRCCCSNACREGSNGELRTVSTTFECSSQTRKQATRIADKDIDSAGSADNLLEGLFCAVPVCDIK